ncbi:MAG: DUF445 family protein [Planctomycetes bacterium]|nr:DUF445 family protein [Planctomycetota bacterium]
MPFVTAFIGWATNWLAIKMLFRPRKPISLLFFSLHGVIPRRQNDLAKQCSEIIESELLHQHMIRDVVRSLEIQPLVEEKIKVLIKEKLALKLKSIPLLGAMINDASLEMIQQIAAKELGEMSQELLHDLSGQVEDKFNIRSIIEGKILEFDLDKLEAIVMSVAQKEFKTIELVGAMLGFLIGVVQVIALYLMPA